MNRLSGTKQNDPSSNSVNDPLAVAADPSAFSNYHEGPDAETIHACVAIVIASANRPSLLAKAIRTCADQKGVTWRGVISVPDDGSLPEDRNLLTGWQVITGHRGASVQRNAALEVLVDVDFVAFFDDDALLLSLIHI